MWVAGWLGGTDSENKANLSSTSTSTGTGTELGNFISIADVEVSRLIRSG